MPIHTIYYFLHRFGKHLMATSFMKLAPQKIPRNWLIGLGIGAMLLTTGLAYKRFSPLSQSPTSSQVAPATSVKIAALGRLEPEAEVIQLSAPLSLDGDRVLELRVKDGDRVSAGQVIAVLDSRDRLQDELKQAQAQVTIAEARLAQVKAGAKSGEIAAQASQVERLKAQRQGDIVSQGEAIARLKAQLQGDREAQLASIQRLKAEANNAEAEYQRYQRLFQSGAISQSGLDGKRLSWETTKQQVNEANAVLRRIDTTAERQLSELEAVLTRTEQTGEGQISEAEANLSRITEVRPVDIRSAQMEVNGTIAGVKRAETALEKAYIRAPKAGQILKIQTQTGEKIGDKGIADVAQTNQMVAIAEVYQSEIAKVKVGQSAKIVGSAFPGELSGQVMDIGREVKKQNIFSNQAGENLDRRIIEVKIRLDDSQSVSGLTNLQIQAEIELNSNNQ
jgi:HlyD family secretion protein